jgi:hypothetical protein
MGGTHWEEVKKRFEEALQLKGSERESLLASVRLASPAVFDEVARLLAGYQQLESCAQTFILNRDLHTEIPFFPTLVRTFEPGEMIADRYEVKRFIATGGMGVVYEVDDRELGERVALKTLRPEFASDPTTRFTSWSTTSPLASCSADAPVDAGGTAASSGLLTSERHVASKGRRGKRPGPLAARRRSLRMSDPWVTWQAPQA